MFCAECEAIAKELGEVYADAWASSDEETKEAWLAVYGMIGGTEDDAEKAEELTPGGSLSRATRRSVWVAGKRLHRLSES